MSAPVRAIDRENAFVRSVNRAASEMMRQTPEHAEQIAALLDQEMEKGPDFASYRRGSSFVEAPAVNLDRNHCARIMFAAETLERKSWRGRRKGRHGGVLGRNAIILLRVLMFVVKKQRGRLFPSYDRLALLCRLSRRSVISAMAKLIFYGFVTLVRRCKRTATAFGARVVQDTNAYVYHLPSKGWGLLASNVFGVLSECKKSPARTIGENNPLPFSLSPLPKEALEGCQGRNRAASAAMTATG